MGEAKRRGSLEKRLAAARRSGSVVNTTKDEFDDWVASQTAKGKPAVTMVQGDDPDEPCHAYLTNASAFAMPVLAALNVPRELLWEIGAHIDFLHKRHTTGHPVSGGQKTVHELDDGDLLHLRITEPSESVRLSLLDNELGTARIRDPDSQVLLLEAVGRTAGHRRESVH